jgi:hypothetical protein
MGTVNSFHETGIKDEEDFTGFLVRQAGLSDVHNHNGVMALLDMDGHRPAFVHPSNVEGIAELFPRSVPDWERLVMNHTRYRLNSAFLPKSKKKGLLKQYRFGAEPGAVSYVGKHQIALRGRLGICLSCIASDYTEHGFAIWHRVHLMPLILYCPTHEEPLMNFCRRRDVSHRRGRKTWYPREQCPRGGALQPIGVVTNHDSIEAAVAIAKMAQDILEGRVDTSAFAVNAGPVLRAKVRRIAQALDRRDYHHVAREHLEFRLGTELTPLLGFANHTFIRVTGHRTSEGPLSNPVQNIAAIWSLFGGWQDFLDEVNARKVNQKRYDLEARTPPKRVRLNPDNKLERWRRHFELFGVVEMKRFRENCRLAILAEKALSPTFTRDKIRHLPDGQKLTYFATHYDQQWLDKNLPSQSRKRGLPSVVARKQIREARKREMVLRRYEDTVRHDPERRITRAFLLSETGGESAYKRGMGSPELESLLDRCADDFETWSKRQVELVTSLARKVDEKSKWAASETYEGFSGNAFSDRLRRAKTWIEKNGD